MAKDDLKGLPLRAVWARAAAGALSARTAAQAAWGAVRGVTIWGLEARQIHRLGRRRRTERFDTRQEESESLTRRCGWDWLREQAAEAAGMAVTEAMVPQRRWWLLWQRRRRRAAEARVPYLVQNKEPAEALGGGGGLWRQRRKKRRYPWALPHPALEEAAVRFWQQNSGGSGTTLPMYVSGSTGWGYWPPNGIPEIHIPPLGLRQGRNSGNPQVNQSIVSVTII